MKLFNGKKTANKILEDLKAEIKESKLKPRLAVVLVGNDAPSKIYVRLKKEAGKQVGIQIDVHKFKDSDRESAIINKIKELNDDNRVSGIIVQLPLPFHFRRAVIMSAINPLKDVDGFHKENQRLLAKGRARFAPPLPTAILLAIKEGVKGRLRNKKAMALVNSETFGKVLKQVLKSEGIKIDYLIRKVCMISGGEGELQEADILITACGCPNMVGEKMIKKGTVIVDAGITRYYSRKVVGDVNRKEVAAKASFLTPVPGGVGPVAVALLLKNVVIATSPYSSTDSF